MNKNTWKWGLGRQWAVAPQLSGGYKEVHKKQAFRFLFFNWSKADEQCGVSLRCTAT